MDITKMSTKTTKKYDVFAINNMTTQFYIEMMENEIKKIYEVYVEFTQRRKICDEQYIKLTIICEKCKECRNSTNLAKLIYTMKNIEKINNKLIDIYNIFILMLDDINNLYYEQFIKLYEDEPDFKVDSRFRKPIQRIVKKMCFLKNIVDDEIFLKNSKEYFDKFSDLVKTIL